MGLPSASANFTSRNSTLVFHEPKPKSPSPKVNARGALIVMLLFTLYDGLFSAAIFCT